MNITELENLTEELKEANDKVSLAMLLDSAQDVGASQEEIQIIQSALMILEM